MKEMRRGESLLFDTKQKVCTDSSLSMHYKNMNAHTVKMFKFLQNNEWVVINKLNCNGDWLKKTHPNTLKSPFGMVICFFFCCAWLTINNVLGSFQENLMFGPVKWNKLAALSPGRDKTPSEERSQLRTNAYVHGLSLTRTQIAKTNHLNQSSAWFSLVQSCLINHSLRFCFFFLSVFITLL